jgi:RimJ/RimL family protein N-acetyltransferase
MTQSATVQSPAPEATAAPAPVKVLRPATHDDLKLVHPRLIEVIETSPFYNDEFKAHEKGRLTLAYLEALVDADPWHVAIIHKDEDILGFMISGPELGILWLYWSYIFPEHRKSGAAMAAMRAFLAHWDNSRFHKVSTYTKPGNDVAAVIMKRFGWTHTATLEQHIFGEDYLLFEHKLQKAVPGYDHGLNLGRMAQLKRNVVRLFHAEA